MDRLLARVGRGAGGVGTALSLMKAAQDPQWLVWAGVAFLLFWFCNIFVTD